MRYIRSILFLVLLVPTLFVYAAEFGGVGGAPAFPDENIPRSKEWFIYSLKPGDKKEDALIVRNNDDVAVDIILYPADSVPSTDGGFALKQFVEPREKVGKWITLKDTELHLEAHQAAQVPFVIEIPNDSKLDVGEHTGGILIQKKNQVGSTSGGMQLLTRVGVRVYVTIPGEIIKKLEITDFKAKLDPTAQKYTVSTTVKNSGNVSQDVAIKLKAKNLYPWLPFLKKEFPIENSRDLQVLRDDSLTSNFEFKKPYWGKLQIETEVIYDNGNQRLSVDPVIIRVPLDRNILIAIILFVAFLISLFFFILISKKRKKEKKPEKKNIKKSLPKKSIKKKKPRSSS